MSWRLASGQGLLFVDDGEKSFLNWTQDTREPMMFPLSKLILSIAQDEHTKKETLTLVKPLLEQVSRSSLS
jgi:hypothetical protein